MGIPARTVFKTKPQLGPDCWRGPDTPRRAPKGMDVRAHDLCVATFYGADGTRLAYHQAGEGDPLICLLSTFLRATARRPYAGLGIPR
jgi:hypothetical protein